MSQLVSFMEERLQDLIDKKERCFSSAERRSTRRSYELNAAIYCSLMEGSGKDVTLEELMDVYDGKITKH